MCIVNAIILASLTQLFAFNRHLLTLTTVIPPSKKRKRGITPHHFYQPKEERP